MTAPALLDIALMRRRRAELGISLRMLADQIGVTAPTYTAIENGHRHAELELGVLLRLSRALGVAVSDLVIGEEQPADADEVSDDAAELGAVLALSDTLTPAGSLCEILGWTLDRLRAARRVLERRLAGVGMGLQFTNSAVKIVTAVGVADEATVAKTMRKHLARNHVSLIEARMLLAVERGQVPNQPTNSERVALGVLVNAALVGFEAPKSSKREAAMVLSDDVRFSLMVDG